MIEILDTYNIKATIKEIFPDFNEEIILYIINLIEMEVDFFLYEKLLTYSFEKNNIILPFKPIIEIKEIIISLNKNNNREEIKNSTYEKNNNMIIIKSDVLENMLLNYNNLHVKYKVKYTCGYKLKEILAYFPLLKKIIEDSYLFYLLNNKFQLESEEYLNYFKKNISLLL